MVCLVHRIKDCYIIRNSYVLSILFHPGSTLKQLKPKNFSSRFNLRILNVFRWSFGQLSFVKEFCPCV